MDAYEFDGFVCAMASSPGQPDIRTYDWAIQHAPLEIHHFGIWNGQIKFSNLMFKHFDHVNYTLKMNPEDYVPIFSDFNDPSSNQQLVEEWCRVASP